MRIFVGGIVTETNTFSPMPTGLQNFEIVRPADLLNRAQPLGLSEVETFQQLCQEGGHEFIFRNGN